MRRDQFLFRAVVVLGVFLAISLTGNAIEWRAQGHTNSHLRTTNRQLARETRRLGALELEVKKSVSSQLANRTHNVYVWCNSINATRDYDRAFVKRVTHGQVVYQLPDLHCGRLATATLKSAKGTSATMTLTSAAAACVPGASVMGCSLGAEPNPAAPPAGRLGVTAPVAGCFYPDVSSYQRHPDWAAASRSVCAAVAKAGEATNVIDPDFAWNVSQLRALRIPWAAYWFVRQCTDGPAFVRELEAVHFKGDRDALRPVLDMEVPSAFNCAVPIANVVHRAFGVWPIIYTAPGTWPGGSSGGLDVWEADYTSAPAPERLPFTALVLGWQRYSPPYLYHYLPGLGYVDVSVDLRGFSKALAFPPPPPKPPPVTHTTTTTPPPPPVDARGVCFGKGATPATRLCETVIRRHNWLLGRRDFWERQFQRCIRYAEGIGCARAEHWWLLRRRQALQLHARYSR